MIKRIMVKKSPTFSHFELCFQNGFNVISGVSGSGKSVFLHTILSVFALREPNAEVIETEITLKHNQLPINFEDMGIVVESLDDNNETIFSVLKKQNTRYFINRQAISKKKLSEISHYFVKYISLKDGNELESDSMLHILDSMIQTKDSRFKTLIEKYQESFFTYKQCENELYNMEQTQKNIENLKDFAQFEINKISKINPQIGEYEKLLHDKKLLSKKEKVVQYCNKALESLDSLASVNKAFELLQIDDNMFQSSVIEARAILENALDDFEKLDIDTESLLERIAELADINRRYGSEEEALHHLKHQQEKLKEYENIEFDKAQLQKRSIQMRETMRELSHAITQKRIQYVNNFEKRLHYFGKQLGLHNISLQVSQAAFSQSGADNLEILLDSKQKSVISSGEYNRMRLCMLCVLAECSTKESGILILDEIDANLSGAESKGVAELLRFLSKNYQIFAISHQPFMPLMSDNHYLVSKDSKGKSSITLLKKEGKIQEIARMISGSNLDTHAIQYAKTLLEQQNKN